MKNKMTGNIFLTFYLYLLNIPRNTHKNKCTNNNPPIIHNEAKPRTAKAFRREGLYTTASKWPPLTHNL